VLSYQQSPATNHFATQALQMVLDTADFPKECFCCCCVCNLAN